MGFSKKVHLFRNPDYKPAGFIMKKTFALLLAVCLVLMILAACSGNKEDATYMPPLPTTVAETPPAVNAPVWRWVTEPSIESDTMRNFENGMAVDKLTASGQYEIINKFGKIITLPNGIVPWSDHYNEGLIAVKNENGLCGYANENDELVIDCVYYRAEDFGEGLAACLL